MILETIDVAKANPILIAGLGTVAFGSVMYAVKSVPLFLFQTAKRLLTIEVDLTSESALYREILDLLTRHRVSALARLFTTDHGHNLVSGYGTSVAFWCGTLIVFKRELIENNVRLDEKMSMTFYTRRVATVQDFVKTAQLPRPSDAITIYTAKNGYIESFTRKRKRELATIFTNGDTIATLVERINWFRTNEEWYRRRGIPYKHVVLLHGPPGTGKSSLIYALASHFNVGLCSITSMSNLDRTIASAHSETVFLLIEDIDMLTVSRESDAPAPAPDTIGAPAQRTPSNDDEDKHQHQHQLNALQVLINTLDGVATPHGLIMFITTNYKERLDKALVRAGRIDLDVEVGLLNAAATRAMFKAFYGDDHVPLLANVEPRTGAELQLIFMEENDPTRAIERLHAPRKQRALMAA